MEHGHEFLPRVYERERKWDGKTESESQKGRGRVFQIKTESEWEEIGFIQYTAGIYIVDIVMITEKIIAINEGIVC